MFSTCSIGRKGRIDPVAKNDRINYRAAYGGVADSKILTFQTENTSIVGVLLNLYRNRIVIMQAAAERCANGDRVVSRLQALQRKSVFPDASRRLR